jgi:hypothetical protein
MTHVLDFQVTSFLVARLFFFLVSAAFLPILDRWKVVPRFDVSGGSSRAEHVSSVSFSLRDC